MGDENCSTAVAATAYDCLTYKTLSYELPLLLLAITMGVFGLVYTFVGYRCFKAVMFLSGLTFGGMTVFAICHEEHIVNHTLSSSAIVGISLGIGILCGLITMLVVYVGLFLQGFFLGMLLGIGAILILSRFYNPASLWAPIGIVFGTGILFALLTLKWQKCFLIVGTSFMGGALICSCIQYFFGKFSLHRYIWDNLMMTVPDGACWFFAIILGIWPCLSLTGILVQWKFTAKGYDHTDVIILNGQQRGVRTHLVREPSRNSSLGTSRLVHQRNRHDPHALHAQQHSVLTNTVQNSSNSESSVRDSDALPPTYDECMRFGVGKPVSTKDCSRIVRTKNGLFLPPAISHNDHMKSRVQFVNNYIPNQRRRTRDSNGNAPTNFLSGRRRSSRRGATQRLIVEHGVLDFE